jgi:hypothetical protein
MAAPLGGFAPSVNNDLRAGVFESGREVKGGKLRPFRLRYLA